MHGSDAPRTARSLWLWPACATLVLALAACSPAAGSASPNGNGGGTPSPSPTAAQNGFGEASSTESQGASPASTGGLLSGTWDGTWAIDPPYAGSAGAFTMELVQT